ncbi:MAG: DUF1700 domain-containing protein [Clostridia bacterium]|nr:DUF1700 domain-containing protein [Clostridia bacterium]
MTYNEWRDELKSNLLCVPEQEMMRVLDYYAEAYADRRDAGYSEREITAEFGAPYDAAQRILAESAEQYPTDTVCLEEPNRQAKTQSRHEVQHRQPNIQERRNDDVRQTAPTQYSTQNSQRNVSDNTWAFILLCVIFAGPIFGIFMAMVGITVGFSVAPFALLISSIATIGAGVVEMFSNLATGAVAIGAGLVLLGLSLIIMPIFMKVVKLMWKLFIRFFAWLKSLFGKKEKMQ